jgi:protein-S-isoprenylcysteine O-methyltransferase Ste14
MCFFFFKLREFMKMNEARVAAGKPKILILNRGLWKWSRHPKYVCITTPYHLTSDFSYFAELSWWWAVAFFGFHLGSPLYFVGTIANTAAMAVVTYMVEKRMSAVKERLQAWNAYKSITSVWVPLPLFLFSTPKTATRLASPTRKASPKRTNRPARGAAK